MYSQYSSAIFGIIGRTVRDNGLAEEILQQSMLKAWNKFDSYDSSKSSLYTWLAVIARRTAIDAVRLKKYEHRQKTESFDLTVYDKGSEHNTSASIDVQSLIDNLDEKYRTLLELMYLQGYSQSEIAKEQGIPLGTVKTRLRQAIHLLRQELKNEKQLFIGLFLLS